MSRAAKDQSIYDENYDPTRLPNGRQIQIIGTPNRLWTETLQYVKPIDELFKISGSIPVWPAGYKWEIDPRGIGALCNSTRAKALVCAFRQFVRFPAFRDEGTKDYVSSSLYGFGPKHQELVEAVLIQAVGQKFEKDDACTRCRKGRGPFTECVALINDASMKGCANCHSAHHQHQCRDPTTVPSRPASKLRTRADDEDNDEEETADEEEEEEEEEEEGEEEEERGPEGLPKGAGPAGSFVSPIVGGMPATRKPSMEGIQNTYTLSAAAMIGLRTLSPTSQVFAADSLARDLAQLKYDAETSIQSEPSTSRLNTPQSSMQSGEARFDAPWRFPGWRGQGRRGRGT